MSIREYMQDEAAGIELELAKSLPVCNEEKEYIFYYSTSPVDENSFKVDKIFYIFVLDRKNGGLKKMLPDEVLPAQMLSDVADCVIFPGVFDEEAMDMEDEYYVCYEKVLDITAKEEIGEDDQREVERLQRLFNQLIPDSALKDIYYYLKKAV